MYVRIGRSGCAASPPLRGQAFEPVERIFDFLPLAIEDVAIENAIMFDRSSSVGPRWDAGRDIPDRDERLWSQLAS